MSTPAKWACGSVPGSRSCSSVEYVRDNPEWRRPSGRPQSTWLKQAHWSCRELFGMERVSTYWAAYTPKEWSGQAGTAMHPVYVFVCVCPPFCWWRNHKESTRHSQVISPSYKLRAFAANNTKEHCSYQSLSTAGIWGIGAFVPLG